MCTFIANFKYNNNVCIWKICQIVQKAIQWKGKTLLPPQAQSHSPDITTINSLLHVFMAQFCTCFFHIIYFQKYQHISACRSTSFFLMVAFYSNFGYSKFIWPVPVNGYLNCLYQEKTGNKVLIKVLFIKY